MTFDKSSFNWTGRVDAIATALGMNGKGLVTASSSDGRVEFGGRLLTSIEPLVPVYATSRRRGRLSPERGHRLLFRFHPNDLGRAVFKGQLLTSNGSAAARPLRHHDSLFAGADLQGAGESEACPIKAAR